MKATALLLTVPMLLAGCVSAPEGAHIAAKDAGKHGHFGEMQVNVYSKIPTNAEPMGTVTARANRGLAHSSDQETTDRALDEAKRQAGSLGANGVRVVNGRIRRDCVWITCSSFYVPE